jgi:RNA polymerase sigma-70 factor (ECF subfamily)
MDDKRHEWFLNQIFHHRAALHLYLRRLVSSTDDLEDLVQETYVRVYALPDYVGVDSPKALLFRIAHNLAVERARRQKAHDTDTVGNLEVLKLHSPDVSPDEQADAHRRFEAFCTAVDRLPPLCRRVFVLRKVYKLSPVEISEVLGVSHSTIEKHVAKGLLRCRDYLREIGMLDGLGAKQPPEPLRLIKDGGHGE